jgi:GTP:adenosylcobinamide-phosphate guanylyltransferase
MFQVEAGVYKIRGWETTSTNALGRRPAGDDDAGRDPGNNGKSLTNMHPETIRNSNTEAGDAGTLTQRNDAYPFPLDAVVLAGTHQNTKRLIAGRNKAFLKVGGEALVRHVVRALVEAETIDQIFVVGPAHELLETLAGFPPRVRVIAQRGKMLTNAWAGIEAIEDFHRNDTDIPLKDRPLLAISCDLPLATGRSIDDFVARCAREDNAADTPYAMLAGVVDAASVEPFHPTADGKGIERPFVQLEFGRLRLANIYVGRPRNLSHQEFLQTGFSYRKAKDWRNVVALTFNFFKSHGGWRAAWLTVRVQLTLMLSKGNGRWYRRLRKGNTRKRVERSVSEVLGGPVKIVITPFGGLSLDVDDEEDLRVLDARFEDWAAITAAVDADSI